eukprot:TRINITY_DN12225_c0_g1_i2.p1 TRINITY_DN12225_c0_g1~~TRINITY_DN12225_c0_g1_i2.p1  ORF type:complete len:310 (+),score=37.20 TRINITY_DN12225_c0_g1_i2:776-1705(+)
MVGVYDPLTNRSEKFCDSMKNSGYSGIFFHGVDPRSDSGMAVFWRHSIFEVVDPNFGVCSEPSVIRVPIRTRSEHFWNLDLHERWHVRNSDFRLEEMLVIHRRHVGFVNLKHLATGENLAVVGCHLMTESRDCKETNGYPGEVRAFELSEIRRLASEFLQSITQNNSVPAIIFAGDFNVDLTPEMNENYIFGGKILASKEFSSLHPDADTEVQFSTGYAIDEEGPYIDWHTRKLREAFSDVHQWGNNVGPDRVCSSYNSKRCSWLDLMWYSVDSLKVTHLSKNLSPKGPIPDEEHGSDHLPISAVFEFL